MSAGVNLASYSCTPIPFNVTFPSLHPIVPFSTCGTLTVDKVSPHSPINTIFDTSTLGLILFIVKVPTVTSAAL